MANKFVLNQEDGTVEGGDIRGVGAVDLQMSRTAATQVANGNYSFLVGYNNTIYSTASGYAGGHVIAGGYNNTITNNRDGAVISGGANNVQASQKGVIAGGTNNSCSGERSTIGGGNHNTTSGTSTTVIGGSNNTASNNGAAVIGGTYNLSSGSNSLSGGYSNIASGSQSVALGYDNTASGVYSVAMGYKANASGSYGIALCREAKAQADRSVAIGADTIASGVRSIALGGYLNQAQGISSCAIGSQSISSGDTSFCYGLQGKSYLFCSSSASSGRFSANGDSQNLLLTARKQDTLTTGATTTLSLDGTGVTNLVIPDGTNRGWNVTIKSIATVTAIAGTATGVNVGDMFIQDDKILFKKVSNTSSIVNSSNSQTIFDTSMSTALMSYSVGGSQDLQIDFISPSFTGGGSVTYRVVSKIELVEVAF